MRVVLRASGSKTLGMRCELFCQAIKAAPSPYRTLSDYLTLPRIHQCAAPQSSTRGLTFSHHSRASHTKAMKLLTALDSDGARPRPAPRRVTDGTAPPQR